MPASPAALRRPWPQPQHGAGDGAVRHVLTDRSCHLDELVAGFPQGFPWHFDQAQSRGSPEFRAAVALCLGPTGEAGLMSRSIHTNWRLEVLNALAAKLLFPPANGGPYQSRASQLCAPTRSPSCTSNAV